MQLARVTGTVTATAKDLSLQGRTLLLCEVIDGAGKLITAGQVAVDTVGAGVGDTVLIATGSAARQASQTSGVSTDASIVAVIDQVSISAKT